MLQLCLSCKIIGERQQRMQTASHVAHLGCYPCQMTACMNSKMCSMSVKDTASTAVSAASLPPLQSLESAGSCRVLQHGLAKETGVDAQISVDSCSAWSILLSTAGRPCLVPAQTHVFVTIQEAGHNQQEQQRHQSQSKRQQLAQQLNVPNCTKTYHIPLTG